MSERKQLKAQGDPFLSSAHTQNFYQSENKEIVLLSLGSESQGSEIVEQRIGFREKSEEEDSQGSNQTRCWHVLKCEANGDGRRKEHSSYSFKVCSNVLSSSSLSEIPSKSWRVRIRALSETLNLMYYECVCVHKYTQ